MTLKLNGSSSGSVSIDAPASTTSGADITFKLPVADGSANQVMKTDASGNLGWTTGLASTHGGVAKAWISCDIDGSNGNRDSFNIAGFTDEGTGDLSITFDTDMANTTYVAILMDDITSYNTRWLSSWSGSGYGGMFTISDRAVGSCRFQNLTTGASMVNSENINIVVFGDQ